MIGAGTQRLAPL